MGGMLHADNENMELSGDDDAAMSGGSPAEEAIVPCPFEASRWAFASLCRQMRCSRTQELDVSCALESMSFLFVAGWTSQKMPPATCFARGHCAHDRQCGSIPFLDVDVVSERGALCSSEGCKAGSDAILRKLFSLGLEAGLADASPTLRQSRIRRRAAHFIF